LGIVYWGLGIGDWAQSQIPNPQSPIPNPQFNKLKNNIFSKHKKINNKYKFLISNKMEDVSSIDSLSENDINNTDEEDDEKMLSILSEMKFNAPFQKYIINQINTIIKDNYKKIMPLFEEKEYSLKEILEEFKQYYQNIIKKEKKKMNKSLYAQQMKESNISDLHQSDIKIENNSAINISEDNKKEESGISFDSLNSSNSLDKFLNDIKVNKQKTELNIISKDEKANVKKEIKELKNFLDI